MILKSGTTLKNIICKTNNGKKVLFALKDGKEAGIFYDESKNDCLIGYIFTNKRLENDKSFKIYK